MKHLSENQRHIILYMPEQGKKQTEIAEIIGVDKSTISRELRRNRDGRSGEYRPDLAQRKYVKRREQKSKHICFTPEIRVRVESLLNQDYSPEQITGSLKKQNLPTVSHERIYQHIWEDKKKGGTLYTRLRRRGRRCRKRGALKDQRGCILGRVCIQNRPKIVEERTRFGDLETDLILGKNHKQSLLTINDRASGMLKMKKVNSKKAEEVSEAIVELLKDWKKYIHTITSDNGKEFAEHRKVAENLKVDYYFARPYQSWQRGSNENLNGLVRRYFPKKSDFTCITREQIKAVEDRINQRPGKRFDYETPLSVMDKLLKKPKVAFTT